MALEFKEHYADFQQDINPVVISSLNNVFGRLVDLEYKYPQNPNTASAKSDTDIWNHLNEHIWGKSGEESSPQGTWNANPNALNTRFQRHVDIMETASNEAQAHRASIENKIDNTNEEIQDIHTKLTNLGEAGGSGLGGLFGGLGIGAIAALGLGLYLVTRKKI
mgnify:CR=1 FL=1